MMRTLHAGRTEAMLRVLASGLVVGLAASIASGGCASSRGTASGDAVSADDAGSGGIDAGATDSSVAPSGGDDSSIMPSDSSAPTARDAAVDDAAGASTGAGDAASDRGSNDAPVDAGEANPVFILGADITWTQQDVAGGATYVDNGATKPILTLLKDHGFNYIRLRTFVDPTHSAPAPEGGTFAPYSTQGFGDISHTVAYAQQIKAAGMGFLLDFHYSDTWADPGKQIKPAAWAGDTLAAAVTHLHDYTKADIQALVAGGGRPDMVQLGNEITPGMLLSPGTALGPSTTSGWAQLAQLLKAGASAVHEVDPTIKIMLHIDRGGDLNSSVAFINSAIANGVPLTSSASPVTWPTRVGRAPGRRPSPGWRRSFRR
jgi:arabinogalactan endo-1,4-beta-galactosidase